MTTYVNLSELEIINFHLTEKKLAELEQLVKNINHNELDTEDKFKQEFENLKKRFLFETVVFTDPKITMHKYVEKTTSMTDPYWPGTRLNVYVINVDIKFTGSTELFRYKPIGYNFGPVTECIIFQPDVHNITIKVEHPNLNNREEIFHKAQQKMGLTYQFIETNNDFIKNWNKTFEGTIKHELITHRKNLQKFYA